MSMVWRGEEGLGRTREPMAAGLWDMLRGRASVWCRVLRHADALWTVGADGVEWKCPDCWRSRRSVLRHLKPGQLA